ncbi:hypothetical protein GQX73_g8933 [Xylaria multiplex]|uniref:Uncharacterized protein n=1 Tax=Xylaria multiplex TaxID=323545 RepID=A0A7C8IRF0_9PEZI|nr:hypothetical protein GQX73_g8933 [Xylaria multiplex]
MHNAYNSEDEYDSDGGDVQYENLNSLDWDEKSRSFETKKDGTVLYYADRPSDYSILADRILWADGCDSNLADGQHGREMTLNVPEIVPFSRFQVQGQRDQRRPRANPTEAQRGVTNKNEIGAKVGYQSIELSGTHNREQKMSWDQVDFDQGTSSDMFSKKAGRRNGVRWAVKQNDVNNHGVC